MCEWDDALLRKGGWMRATEDGVHRAAPALTASTTQLCRRLPSRMKLLLVSAATVKWTQKNRTNKNTYKQKQERVRKKTKSKTGNKCPRCDSALRRGEALLSRCVSCWLRACRGARLVSRRGPGRTSRSTWHLCRAFCLPRTLQWSNFCLFVFLSLFFSPNCQERKYAPRSNSAAFVLLLFFVTAEQVVIFFNAT